METRIAHLSHINRRRLLSVGACASATVVAGRARAAARHGKGELAGLEGRWAVDHRVRGADGAWRRMSGTCVVSPVMGGLGAVEDHAVSTPSGLAHRASLRLFDPASGLWSSWMMGRAGTGVGPRLIGRCAGGGAVFHGAEMARGRVVDLRQAWSGISADGARWTQAESDDGGVTWTPNYLMEFKRLG